MWIPVVIDTINRDTRSKMMADESFIEAVVQVVPASVLETIEFVWVRDRPTNPPQDNLIVTFRAGMSVDERLAAIIQDEKGTVLEVYLDNVRDGLTDEWLRDTWGISPTTIALAFTERIELTIFAVLVHYGIRQGLTEEAKALVRKIGRVIFRAAVRYAVKNLEQMYPGTDFAKISPSVRSDGHKRVNPIDAKEAAQVDYYRLFRQFLGVDSTGPAEENSSSRSAGDS